MNATDHQTDDGASRAQQQLARQVGWLVDRAKIEELISAFARTVDTKDWQGFASLFSETGTLVMPWEEDNGPGITGRDNLARFGEESLGGFHQTQHMITNCQIIIDGDVASSTQYLHSAHVRSATDQEDAWHHGGWYRAKYARTAEGWKFTRLALETVWQSAAAGELESASTAARTQST